MSSFSDEENGVMTDDGQVERSEAPDEGYVESPAESDAQPTGIGAWLRGLIAGGSLQHLDELSDAIALDPAAASNYVLRGDIYMKAGEYALAAADYENALRLAAEQFESEDWGVLSQILRDQAQHGLERASRQLARWKKKRSPD